jgi:hypothetical protein
VLGRAEEEPTPQSLVSGATHTVGDMSTAPPETVRGPREGPLIFLFVVLTLAASVFVLHRSEERAVADPKQKAARGEVQGLVPLSLVRQENLQRALAKVDAGRYPFISNIRVAPDRINFNVRDRDGMRKYLTVDAGFGVKSSDAGVGDDYAIRAPLIDAAAPERMLKLVSAKTGLPPSALDYVTTSFPKDSPTTWYLSLKQGPARTRAWIAEANGTDIRKPGELSSKDRRRIAADKRRSDAQRRKFEREQRQLQVTIQRRTRCLTRATNATQVSRCVEKYQP